MTMITYGNTTQTISNWIREGVASPNSVYRRMKQGWDIMAAISTPTTKQHPNSSVGTNVKVFTMFQGQRRSANEIAKITGWSGNSIRNYIRQGKPITMKPEGYTKTGRIAKPMRDFDVTQTQEEYVLSNLRKSMTDDEIREHLLRGKI